MAGLNAAGLEPHKGLIYTRNLHYIQLDWDTHESILNTVNNFKHCTRYSKILIILQCKIVIDINTSNFYITIHKYWDAVCSSKLCKQKNSSILRNFVVVRTLEYCINRLKTIIFSYLVRDLNEGIHIRW